MSVTVQSGTTVPFEQFWRWLKHHANCILRAGTTDVWFYDQEAFHWHLEEDDDRNPVVQVYQGKAMIAELLIDARTVLFVQATPDTEGEAGQFLFELVGGPQEEPAAVYHFLLAHAFEDEQKHGALKH